MTSEMATMSEDAEGQGPHQHIKQLEGENKALRLRIASQELRDAGLDPSKGLGKAVLTTYKGDFSEGDIVRFARDEYQWEPDEAPAPVNPAVEATTQAEAAVSVVEAASESVQPAIERPSIEVAKEVVNDPTADLSDVHAGLDVIAADMAQYFQTRQ